MSQRPFISISGRELFFQLILHLVVFVFYAFDRRDPGFETDRIFFFLSYSLAAGIINYVLLPRFFYRRKYLKFLIALTVLIALVMIVEELVLEKLIFPGTQQARGFPGVFYTLVDILPVITILSGFKFAWDAISKQNQLENLRAIVKESELQFLKSQINPHFLFNNLNNLYSYALSNSPKTPEIILNLSAVLRYMLYECKERYVALSKEIKQLENFTQLYQLQIEDRGVVEFTAERIDSEYKIAPLILSVFIENAFKHSQAGQSENIDIRIHVTMAGDRLKFSCVNNFQYIEKTDKIAEGIGLKNVKKRLDLLYPNAYSLDFDTSNNNFGVALEMKLQKMEES